MMTFAGIEAALLWSLMIGEAEGTLNEPSEDYSGLLESMEAAQLLKLMEQVQERLKALGVDTPGKNTDEHSSPDPEKLFISKDYSIRLGCRKGMEVPFRPLVKALFILFLKHPEGILLKERDQYTQELEDIYAVIAPNVDAEDRRNRIHRMVSLQDNSFSEKASVLNATLGRLLPPQTAHHYKIQGYNGHPRRIPLSRVLVEWE